MQGVSDDSIIACFFENVAEDVSCAVHGDSLAATTNLDSDLVAASQDDDNLLSAGGDEDDSPFENVAEDVSCAVHGDSLVATTNLDSDALAVFLDDDNLLSVGGDEDDTVSGIVHVLSPVNDVPLIANTNLYILRVIAVLLIANTNLVNVGGALDVSGAVQGDCMDSADLAVEESSGS